MLNKKYMYHNKWTAECEKLACLNQESKSEACAVCVENGILLPQKAGELIWGQGGCLRADGTFVEESGISGAFGGRYEYGEADDYCDEAVIYIPIIPNHWGHFLIDTVSRLYILSDKTYYKKDKKIFYCSWRFEGGKLTGNYLRFFQLLGINEKSLIAVQKPVRVRKIIIPKAALSYSGIRSCKYMIPAKRIVKNVIDSGICDSLKAYERIYFTRTRLASSKKKEIGEEELEWLIANNGFQVMSPEKMSLEEQIYYIYHCKVMAGLSGTIPHNIIFAGNGMELVILNRTCMPNPPQFLLNRICKGVKVTYVDAYHKVTVKHPSDYGSGPFWIGVNKNVRRFCKDYGMAADRERKHCHFKNALKYYSLLFYYRVSRNQFTIRWYRKIREILYQ